MTGDKRLSRNPRWSLDANSADQSPQVEPADVLNPADGPKCATGRIRAGLKAGTPCALSTGRRETMLFTIAVILLVLWLLGLVSGYTMGNFIYVLLVIALVLFVVGLVSGRRTV
jgi:hypothetical protein